MPAEVTLPVSMRIGNTPEAEIGTITLSVRDGEGYVELSGTEVRALLADLLQAVADEMRKPDDETIDEDTRG